MLTEQQRELLTAAVDGELTLTDRKTVERLLRDSEEARQFHEQVKADASRLRQLPKSRPHLDLATEILNTILNQDLRPTPLPTRRHRRDWRTSLRPSWIPLVTAAGVLIAVGILSYLYFTVSERYYAAQKNDLAQKTSTQPTKNDPKPNLGNGSTVVQLPANNNPELGPTPRQVPEVAVVKNADSDPLPHPRLVDQPQDVLAGPSVPDRPPLEVFMPRLPLILPLRDLDQAYPKEKLREHLKKDEVIHLDLFCKDITKASDAIQALLKARGRQVIVDAHVATVLKKKQTVDLLIFTDTLTQDEIATFLEQLGNDDRKAEAKKAGENLFEKFVLGPYVAADLDRLAKLLGVPAAQLKMPKPKLPFTLQPGKTLEGDTAKALANNLPKTPGAKPADNLALVISYSPANPNPQTSKEIKSFLDRHADRKSGNVPLLLVLRTVN